MSAFRGLGALAVFIVGACLLVGCASAFRTHAATDDFPVQWGAATTNDTQAVAWLLAARALNRAANPTPTAPVVDTILGAGVLLAGAVGGYLTRHHAQKGVDVERKRVQDSNNSRRETP